MNKKHSQPKTATGPSKSKFCVLRQMCNLIPPFLVSKLAHETGVDAQARSYTPWSHVVTLLYAQLVHAIGLNDVCDSLRLHRGLLVGLRGATPPSRNNLSHANRHRDAALAEKLFWAVLEHLRGLHVGFATGRQGRGLARRFRRVISVVDSTTIQLVASCMDWAQHRRRKAAAKCHLRLDLHSFLPRFALIDTARDHDATRARELCAGIRPGEIVLFDKAYVDFAHLWALTLRGIFWVTRAKDNMVFDVIEQRPVQGAILRDDIVCLGRAGAFADYPAELRRIVAVVEVDGREQEMVFLTNNRQWSAQTIADLYRCRWNIEVFFKQIKQTLQLADFLGHQRQRRALASLDGTPGLRPAALFRRGAWLASQLHPPLYPLARRTLAALGPRQPAPTLWDSTRRFRVHRHPATALFRGNIAFPVGQHASSIFRGHSEKV